jgi:hypothetical protein
MAQTPEQIASFRAHHTIYCTGSNHWLEVLGQKETTGFIPNPFGQQRYL